MRVTILDLKERTRTIESYGCEVCVTNRGSTSMVYMEPARASSCVRRAEPLFRYARTWLSGPNVECVSRFFPFFSFGIQPNHVYLASHESRLARFKTRMHSEVRFGGAHPLGSSGVFKLPLCTCSVFRQQFLQGNHRQQVIPGSSANSPHKGTRAPGRGCHLWRQPGPLAMTHMRWLHGQRERSERVTWRYLVSSVSPRERCDLQQRGRRHLCHGRCSWTLRGFIKNRCCTKARIWPRLKRVTHRI